MILGAERYYML